MKMKISTRLALGFATMLLLVIAAAVVGIVSLNRIGELMATVAAEADQSAALGSIRAGVTNTVSNVLMALENPSIVSSMTAKVLLEGLNDQITAYEHPMKPQDVSVSDWSTAHPEAAESCAAHCHAGPTMMAIEEKRVAYTDVVQEYLDEAQVREVGMTTARYTIGVAADDLVLATDSMALAQSGTLSRVEATVGQIESYTRMLMLVSAIVAAILGVLLAITITRSITVPLANLVSVSDKISTGELDTPVPVAAKDEIGELAESMERMRISIKALIERMRSRSGG